MMTKRKNRHSKRSTKQRWTAGRVITWATLGTIGVTIAVLSFFAFTGDDQGPRTRVNQEPVVTDEQEVTVDVEDNFFEPNDLTVRAGTEVTWKFKGDAVHDVTEENGAFGSGTLGYGDQHKITFEAPGTYYYYCTLHHVMQGTVTVKE